MRLLRRFMPYRCLLLCGAILLVACVAAWPGAAFASECDTYDLPKLASCQADAAVYETYEGAAAAIWLLDRVLLGGAYWMDALRHQFIQIVFMSAYKALTDTIEPLLGPIATLALAIGALALIALPVTGSRGPINMRNILIWGVAGPMLLTMSGPYLAQFEQFRTDFGVALFNSVAGGPLTISESRDMAKPEMLYPSEACGVDAAGYPRLWRYGQTETPNVDEQVAALAWADAKDIHCPERPMPARLYHDGNDGPGYLYYGTIRDLDGTARQTYLEGVKTAVNRLLLTIAPAFVAALIALLNLVFACCTMMLWFSLPLGLLFSFFQTNSGWFTTLVQRGAGILKTSWIISILLGLFSSVLMKAGADGDALRYSIMTIISGIFVVKFCFIAFGLFTESLNTMTTTAGLGGGPSLGKLASGAAGGAVGLAAGMATGGAGLALTMAAARKQTGSTRYALATGAGRFRPLMQLGEVAASMGMLSDEVSSGLYAGHRSAESTRSGRMAMQADARRKGDDELTIRERAENRRLDRQMRRAERGNLTQRTVMELRLARSAGRAAAGAISKELSSGDLRRAGATAIREAIAEPGEAVSKAVAPALAAGRRAAVRAVTSGERALMRRMLPQEHVREVMRIERGKLTFRERLAEDQLPADAKTEPLDRHAVWAMLRDGYAAQRNDDETVTYWRPPANEHEAKALAGKARARRAARLRRSRQPSYRRMQATRRRMAIDLKDN